MSKFKVGDRVRFVSSHVTYGGHVGTILRETGSHTKWVVKLDSGEEWFTMEGSLESLEESSLEQLEKVMRERGLDPEKIGFDDIRIFQNSNRSILVSKTDSSLMWRIEKEELQGLALALVYLNEKLNGGSDG